MLPEFPPLPELPAIKEAGSMSSLDTRLPGAADIEKGGMSMSNHRQQQVAEEMRAIKIATEERKFYEREYAKRAKAKGRAAQRWAEGR